MSSQIVRFATLVFSGLLAGAMLAIMIGLNTKTLSFRSYVEQQQMLIKAFNVLMPLLGAAVIILTFLSAFIQKRNTGVFASLIIAAILLLVSGLITRFGNQPINAIVMTWTADSPPVDWTVLRDRWLALHTVRTFLSVVAFCIVGWSSLK